jgi:hypothetical protein
VAVIGATARGLSVARSEHQASEQGRAKSGGQEASAGAPNRTFLHGSSPLKALIKAPELNRMTAAYAAIALHLLCISRLGMGTSR